MACQTPISGMKTGRDFASTVRISSSAYSRQKSSAVFASESPISASEVAAEAGVAPAALLETSGICGGAGIAFRVTIFAAEAGVG